MIQLEQYLDELRSVVNVDCGTQTRDGVARVADVFTGLYRDAGWHAEQVDLGDRVGPGSCHQSAAKPIATMCCWSAIWTPSSHRAPPPSVR